jgi:hypothetical protein
MTTTGGRRLESEGVSFPITSGSASGVTHFFLIAGLGQGSLFDKLQG